MPFTSVGDVELFHSDHGDGSPPLLLVHGWGSNGDSWAQHVALLQERHRVLVPDLRGHGRSSAPPGDYDAPAFAADLVGLLDHLGVERVVAVGHSMGGQIVSQLDIDHPDRVVATVNVDPGYGVAGVDDALPIMLASLDGPDAGAAACAIDGGYGFTPDTPPWIKVAGHRSIEGTAGHVLRAGFEGMFFRPGQFGLRPESVPHLARRTRPTLSVWASSDNAGWEASIPLPAGSEIVRWEGVGHYLHQERPEAFVDLLERWLATLPQ